MAQSQSTDDFGTVGAANAGPPVGQLLLRRKWLIMFGTIVGVGLGYLYFTQQPAVYKSIAELQVYSNVMNLPTSQYQQEVISRSVETQCDTIKSGMVIKAAVDNGNLAKRPEFLPHMEGARARALSSIANKLVAQPKGKYSETILVSYLGSDPQGTKAVVDAVVNAYQEYIGDSDQNQSQKVIQLVTQAKDVLLKDLDNLEKELKEFKQRYGSALLNQGKGWINPYAERLIEIENKKTAVILHRSEIQSRIKVIVDAMRNGGSREALRLMIDQLAKGDEKSDAGLIAKELFPLMLKRELLAQRLGPDHPELQTINRQIAITQAHLNKMLKINGVARGPDDLLKMYIQSLQYEIETTDTELKSLASIYVQVEADSKKLAETLGELREIEKNIDRKDALFNTVVQQLEEMDLFNSQGLQTEVITHPKEGFRTPEKRAKYMGVGGALGLILFAVLAYLLESNDKSFRTPEDIRDELGVSVVGHVPVIPSKVTSSGSSASPALCTVHAPRGHSSEAFRLVRTSLFFGARSGNLRVIQVTSPDQGDGKSTMTANLAVTIAQSGRRTLLIDADLRRPTQHRIFGMSNEVGLSDVIGSDVDPQDAIHESETPNLSLLFCGPHPHNPAELLSSHQFEEFLGWARDNYDFVLVDTPPLLAVSDPGNVASRVDGALLTLRLGKRARAKGAEAVEIMERVGANMLGVVINGVNARGEYGYQSKYHYTSISTTKYGYGDNYYSPDEPVAVNGKAPRLGSHRVNGHS